MTTGQHKIVLISKCNHAFPAHVYSEYYLVFAASPHRHIDLLIGVASIHSSASRLCPSTRTVTMSLKPPPSRDHIDSGRQNNSNGPTTPPLSTGGNHGTLHRRSGSFGSRNENWWNLSDHIPSTSSHDDSLDETWTLSDSLVDISPEHYMDNVLKMTPKRTATYTTDDIDAWLAKDTSNGFIRVYPPDVHSVDSDLVACSLTLTSQKLCLQLGLANNELHVQYNGDVIRRLDPYANPLVLQNDYLTSLGFTDMVRIQREGTKPELASLLKFYSGKMSFLYQYSKSRI